MLPTVSERLRDEDVERIARRVVVKIAKLAALIVLAWLGVWAFVFLFAYAVRAYGPSGAVSGAAGWLTALAIAVLILAVLAGWRLLRRGLR